MPVRVLGVRDPSLVLPGQLVLTLEALLRTAHAVKVKVTHRMAANPSLIKVCAHDL